MLNTIKNLVKAEIALIVFTIVAIFFTDTYLPAELQEYLALESEYTPTTLELIAHSGLVIIMLVNLVSLFGLLWTKAWARKAYIFSTIFIFPLCIFIGPQVDHAIGYTLDQLSVLIQGMIMSLLIYNSSYQEAVLNKSSNSDDSRDAGS